MKGPLARHRILEVGTMLAGPAPTMILADLRAEVIKVEPPGGEIPAGRRQLLPASTATSAARPGPPNSEAGQRPPRRLVAQIHTVLVNMKPSVIKELSLTTRRCVNDRNRLVAITDSASTVATHPVFDYVIQAATGVAAAMTNDPGRPADAARFTVGRQLHNAFTAPWVCWP